MSTFSAAIGPHTELLLRTARSLDDTNAASLCVGWTRGHILTHLARNADGLAALIRAAADGTGETMYASDQARDAAIDAGARRDLDALVDDVEHSATTLAALLPRIEGLDPDTEVERIPDGPRFRIGQLPFLRLRELVYHHVDLDAGFTFHDVGPELIAAFLADEYARLAEPDRHAALASDVLWRARGIREESR